MEKEKEESEPIESPTRGRKVYFALQLKLLPAVKKTAISGLPTKKELLSGQTAFYFVFLFKQK